MAAITNFAWKGRGRVWVGDSATGGLRELGNCTSVSIAFDTTEDELPDYRTTADGNYASDVQIDAANVSITFHDMSPDNLALAFYGTTTAVAAALVSDESLTAPSTAGQLIATDYMIDCTATGGFTTATGAGVFSATGGAGTEFTAGTDYFVYPGGVKFPSGTSVTGAATVYVSYLKEAATRVEGLMAASSTKFLQLDLINKAGGGEPMVVRIWQFKPSPADDVPFISGDYASPVMSGKADADSSRASGVSDYFTIERATTT